MREYSISRDRLISRGIAPKHKKRSVSGKSKVRRKYRKNPSEYYRKRPTKKYSNNMEGSSNVAFDHTRLATRSVEEEQLRRVEEARRRHQLPREEEEPGIAREIEHFRVHEMQPSELSAGDIEQIKAMWQSAFPGRDWRKASVGNILEHSPPEKKNQQGVSIFVGENRGEIVSMALVQAVTAIDGAPAEAIADDLYNAWTASSVPQNSSEAEGGWSPPSTPARPGYDQRELGSLSKYNRTLNEGRYISNICTTRMTSEQKNAVLSSLIESIVLKYGDEYDLVVHHAMDMDDGSNMLSIYGQSCFRVLKQIPRQIDGSAKDLLLRPIKGRWDLQLYSQSISCAEPTRSSLSALQSLVERAPEQLRLWKSKEA